LIDNEGLKQIQETSKTETEVTWSCTYNPNS